MIAVELAFERNMRREAECKGDFPRLVRRASGLLSASVCAPVSDFPLIILIVSITGEKREREIGESIVASSLFRGRILSGAASRQRLGETSSREGGERKGRRLPVPEGRSLSSGRPCPSASVYIEAARMAANSE